MLLYYTVRRRFSSVHVRAHTLIYAFRILLNMLVSQNLCEHTYYQGNIYTMMESRADLHLTIRHLYSSIA
jgi:hypothetical protein